MKILPLWASVSLCTALTACAALPPRSDYESDTTTQPRAQGLQMKERSSWLLGWRFLEGTTAKDLTGGNQVLFDYAPYDNSWSHVVTGALELATNGQVLVTFSPDDLNTNSADVGVFEWDLTISDGTDTLCFAYGDLDIIPRAGGSTTNTFPDDGSPIDWLNYSNYLNTASHGPYRIGSNVTFEANADGSQKIHASVTGGAGDITSITNAGGTTIHGGGSGDVGVEVTNSPALGGIAAASYSTDAEVDADVAAHAAIITTQEWSTAQYAQALLLSGGTLSGTLTLYKNLPSPSYVQLAVTNTANGTVFTVDEDGDVVMDGHLTLGNPDSSADAMPVSYADARYLLLTGGTMAGHINFAQYYGTNCALLGFMNGGVIGFSDGSTAIGFTTATKEVDLTSATILKITAGMLTDDTINDDDINWADLTYLTTDGAAIDEAYGPGWNADPGPPEKDDVYDKIEALAVLPTAGASNTVAFAAGNAGSYSSVTNVALWHYGTIGGTNSVYVTRAGTNYHLRLE